MKITCPQCKRRIRIRRGENVSCKCGSQLSYMQFFRDMISYVVYLIDANILIYAENKKDKRSASCRKVLKFNSPSIKIGTTDVILDEINIALNLKLLLVKDIIRLIKKTPKRIELVLTGRYAPREIIKIADLVSEAKEVKHYYKKGIKARRGIEF